MNKNLQKSSTEGIEEFDENTNSKNHAFNNLVNSNTVDSSIIKTVFTLPNDKNRSQFSLEPMEGNPSLFTINHTNPQQVKSKVQR